MKRISIIRPLWFYTNNNFGIPQNLGEWYFLLYYKTITFYLKFYIMFDVSKWNVIVFLLCMKGDF